ncbi:peptide chain release factor N(5)-glutamine methyltransferase [Paenibacillus sp. NPDC058071]|uniref:peptide chain release factor N(5)-glutamine methyltransferase n=1 Tax=Paenibacillus sp. NPDC058071 TaxID=3346326 RepID=UPI0036D781B5
MSDQTNGRPFAANSSLSIREACLQASSFLTEQGVEEARSNAELLLMHILGLTRSAMLSEWHEPFPAERADEWELAVRRKGEGEPVQYIIGEEWFYGRPFTVTPAVLIPRPETELLVEAVLEAADRLWPAGGEGVPSVVDVGTGSGAIAVTLSAERPRWRVNASDLSEDALAVARSNAALHEAADRVSFRQGDLLEPFLPVAEAQPAEAAASASKQGAEQLSRRQTESSVDVLVSNPPYIPADDLPGLQREVRDYEPHLALDGGADGLVPYRRMLEQLPALPRPPRIVAFELGIGQAPDIAAMLERYGAWDEVRIVTDYNGIERHVIAVRTSNGNSV